MGCKWPTSPRRCTYLACQLWIWNCWSGDFEESCSTWYAANAETESTANRLGIGKFTIADNELVTEADLGVNFFLDQSSLGKSRAESCVKLLQELNPDVKGDWSPKIEVGLTSRDDNPSS
jgi:hypothetical protein